MFESDKNKFQKLIFQMHLKKVSDVYAAFEKEGISPVLIKGMAAAVNYPKPFQRVFSDIDLAVDPKIFETAGLIVSKNKFNVDLHKGLRHLDTADWKYLYENSRLVNIDGITIRTLRPEDHLRVLCTHWLNDGGADRTRLWDMYFALKKSSTDFDRKLFFNPVDAKRREWLAVVLLSASYYLGLNLSRIDEQMPFSELPVWVKSELEKEWSNDVRLTPLQNIEWSYGKLLPQLRKRFPPNILQAIVETENEIDADKFFLVRAGDFIKRARIMLKNIRTFR